VATKGKKSAGSQFTSRGITQGNTIVGPQSGLPIDEVVDGAGVRRLAVDTVITLDSVSLDVDLNYVDSSVSIGDAASGNTLNIEPDGSLNTNTEVDAADGDNIALSAHPTQIFSEASDTLTTAAFEQVFTYTSIDNDTKIAAIHCSVSTPARIRILINGVTKYEKWSSPTERNVIFDFKEHRSLVSGQIITVEAKVERLIFNSYDTFVTMEGYIA
jgi:hypothetical protein